MTYSTDNMPGAGASGMVPSVGQALRELREQRGWSVADVSARLKFAPRQIEALENEDWSGLPRGSSLRGFLRNYARLLEIDPEPLLTAVEGPANASVRATDQPVAAAAVVTPLPSTAPRGWSGGTERRRGVGVVGIVLALIAVGAVYAVMQERLPEQFQLARLLRNQSAANAPREVTLSPGTVTSTSTAPVAGATPAAPAAPAVSAPTPTELVPAAPSAPPAAAAPAPGTTSSVTTPVPLAPTPAAPATAPAAGLTPSTTPPLGGTAPMAVQPTPTPPTPTAAPTAAPTTAAAPAGTAPLVVRITRDSWVDVRDAKGTVLVSQVLTAGSERSFDVAPPVKVVVGNAQGATLSWQGKPVDLKGSRDNVARLTLQ